MASSTTIPVASTSPNRIRLLRLEPLSFTRLRLPTSATGTARPGIRARRHRPKNSTSTISTSSTASRKVMKVRSRLASTVSATSTIIESSMPGGKLGPNCCNLRLIALLTSRALAPSRW